MTQADVFHHETVAKRMFFGMLLRHAPPQPATQHNLPQTAGFYQARLSELCHNDLQHGKIISVH